MKRIYVTRITWERDIIVLKGLLLKSRSTFFNLLSNNARFDTRDLLFIRNTLWDEKKKKNTAQSFGNFW